MSVNIHFDYSKFQCPKLIYTDIHEYTVFIADELIYKLKKSE